MRKNNGYKSSVETQHVASLFLWYVQIGGEKNKPSSQVKYVQVPK